MIIKKILRAESSHIVRNCTSKRCSGSIHGHSGVIELEFESDGLDNAGMVLDFGLMKPIKEFIDSLDHTHLIWNKDDDKFKDFIKNHNERWIELPCNPSAEMLTLWIWSGVQLIINNLKLKNNESPIKIHAITYHETVTGSATASINDYSALANNLFLDSKFSLDLESEHKELFRAMRNNSPINVDNPRNQVKL